MALFIALAITTSEVLISVQLLVRVSTERIPVFFPLILLVLLTSSDTPADKDEVSNSGDNSNHMEGDQPLKFLCVHENIYILLTD